MDTNLSTDEQGDSSQTTSDNENVSNLPNTEEELDSEQNLSDSQDVVTTKTLTNLIKQLEIPKKSEDVDDESDKENSTVETESTIDTHSNDERNQETSSVGLDVVAKDTCVIAEGNLEDNSVEAESSTTDTETIMKDTCENEEKNQNTNIMPTEKQDQITNRDERSSDSDNHMEVDQAELSKEGLQNINMEDNINASENRNVETTMDTSSGDILNVVDKNNEQDSLTCAASTSLSHTMEIDDPKNLLNIDEGKGDETNNKSSSINVTDDTTIDNIELISTDQEKSSQSDEQQQNKDPVTSDSSTSVLQNKTNGNDDSILPDACKANEESSNKTNQSATQNDELYIVTKTTEKSSCICMECATNHKPMYKCSFDSNTLYICTENCLKRLKERKAEKVIVRDLRVKVFASEGLRSNLPLVTLEENIVDLSVPKCSECGLSAKSTSISWNSFNLCNEICLAAYQKTIGTKCIECESSIQEAILGRYSVRFGKDIKQFCKNSCLLEHKKGQKFCTLCQGQMSGQDYNGYCSTECFELHNGIKLKKNGICSVCMNEKELEIKYDDNNRTNMFCSEPCFVAYKFVNKINPVQCEFCKLYTIKRSVLVSFFYDGMKHTLCSQDCCKLFIIMTRKIVHCAWCNVKKYNFDMIQFRRDNTYSILCSLNCYYLYKSGCDYCHKDTKPLFHLTTMDSKVHNFCSAVCLSLFKDGLNENPLEDRDENSTDTTTNDTVTNGTDPPPPLRPVKKIVVIKPRPIPKQRNVTTMCKPYQITKSISCKPKDNSKSCQTDAHSNKFLLPVPVPIYVPTPACMFSLPVPCPLPIPLPIPVPIFIPTTRKSTKGILKEITKIKNKVPADPLEAELLMMAEMVAEDKKDESDSESEEEPIAKETTYTSEPEQMDTNNSFGEEVLQMALKMASDFEEPVDLEGAVNASTIAPGPTEDSAQRIGNIMETKRRSIRQARQVKKKHTPAQHAYAPGTPQAEMDKPDANLCLKFTFGVNAWKQWVTTKNLELQKAAKRAKLFKTEILQLTSDELNYSLCLFVKEVRKPNGAEYAPDTIYYLCLGIQQYLYENGRVDNIFCDTFYEKFTDCLNEVCQKFSLLYNESQYIVTRVEEEHLWESKQLGAHSPLVLLNTLMFFNTKHFSLTTVAEHLQLSFSHIMKHWKRNPNQPGSRNVLLRFYLPQTAEGARKKKVYEQQENEENPLRCPVKLYEFYLSKCPESVKTRNDVFYLQPERSCVPDSPVWYSTMALDKEALEKMLNRVKMVKEINVAILTT